MPQLSDLLEKKKFVKKAYRPWDLSGSGTIDTPNDAAVPEESSRLEEEPVSVQKDLEVNQNERLATVMGNKSNNELANTRVTSKEHTDNNRVTTLIQPSNKQITARQQPDNYRDNVTSNITDITYLTDLIKKLTGIQKKLFLYVVHICSVKGTLETGNILSLDLANAAQCSVGSAKTSLNRLIEKNLIIRHPGKASRGGHMILGITKEIQTASIHAQQILFNPLHSQVSDNIIGNLTGNNLLHSSSNYNNKTITTELPEDWKKIDYEALKRIGFSQTQLKQLIEHGLTTPEILQESINHFAFGLEKNEKVKAYQDPLNVLMGVLRKGQKWHEPGYISPQELALQQIIEEKRKRKEKLDGLVKELVELEFPEWKSKLSEMEIKNIVPAETLRSNMTSAIQSALRTYFIDKVLLPRLRADGLISEV